MFQQTILIGHLGADPELRRTQSGVAVATLRIATNNVRKDEHGNKQEQTEWHSVVVWQRAAETTAEYCRKGSLVKILGELRTRKWQGQDGADRYTTEIHAKSVKFLKHANESGGGLPSQAEAGPVIEDEDIPF